MSKTKTEVRSLSDFVKAKKRADCPVCALPDDIREQLVEAGRKKIGRRDQVEWLNQEVGVDVTYDDLTSHCNARHDAA